MTGSALYGPLAPWFHLLTPPADYADEAAVIKRLLREHIDGSLATLLELGAGGGNVASHLDPEIALTLTDLAPEMLDVSRRINPAAEHVVGDMRTLRLGRTFDAVLVHDAICYMTTEADLHRAVETAFAHLRPGGAAVLAPDFVAESFKPGIEAGGSDGVPSRGRSLGRGLRYLEWTVDADPADGVYEVDYAILARDEDRVVTAHHDRHVEGLFARQAWLDLMADVGFEAAAVADPDGRTLFVGRRR